MSTEIQKLKSQPIPSVLKPEDLCNIARTEDGSMSVKLERFGKVRIQLPNSALFIELQVVRNGEGFMTTVVTGASGTEKEIAAAKKANDGNMPGFEYFLAMDGKFVAA